MLELRLEVRRGPRSSMKERKEKAFCKKTHSPQWEEGKAGLVCASSPQTVISRVRLMCSTEQVIYRVAQDPNSLNVVHELVFQTFRNEL